MHPVWARGGHVTDTWPLLYFVKHSLLVCVFTEETPFGWLKKTSCPSTGRRIGSAQKPSATALLPPPARRPSPNLPCTVVRAATVVTKTLERREGTEASCLSVSVHAPVSLDGV